MDSFAGPCPHQSVPVEMDESMTPSSLDLAWPPPCQRCGGQAQTGGMQQDQRRCGGADPSATEDGRQPEPRAVGHASPGPAFAPHSGQLDALRSAGAWHFGVRGPAPGQTSAPSNCPQEFSVEEVESLELPLPLVSSVNSIRYDQAPQPAAGPPGQYPSPGRGARPEPCGYHVPANLPRHDFDHHFQPKFRAGPHQRPPLRQQLWNSPQNQFNGGLNAAPALPRDMMHEVSVGRPLPTDRGQQVTGETRRTISIPEESRKVFITYSLDTAKEMLPFTKFLTDQGFKPAIDIFDNPIRRMDITRWMDGFLKDKSVLIIVVISPQYKEDVEGEADDDEHGLHTKYIHNQLQDEFIQMGCRNFRLVPVLFSNATKRDVPSWLQSTRIYRWPADVQDLLLRLLREERYIIPASRGELTLTVRPL